MTKRTPPPVLSLDQSPYRYPVLSFFYQNIVQNSINVFNFNSDLLYHDAIQYILCSLDEQPPGHTAGFSTVQAVTFQGPANIHEMFLPQMPERSLGLAETEFPPFH